FQAFYVGQPGRFALAFLLALANWAVGALELYMVMHFLERPIAFADAWLIEAAVQLVRTGAFFIPAGLGAIEGVLVLFYAVVVGDGALGLVVAVIRRARELLWILWGLALAWRFAPGKTAQAGEGR
ncbi:MAG: lysylphosphatidylglycerol synthase domain-containing protein, partial [Kiloniellales bacterium]